MTSTLKLALIDTSESSSLTLVNQALEFAETNKMVVALFDADLHNQFYTPAFARVEVSKNYDRFFAASAHLGKTLASIGRLTFCRNCVAETMVFSNLYTADTVYPTAIKTRFVALPGSEGIEWFKGEYPWAKVFSWGQLEDEYDRA